MNKVFNRIESIIGNVITVRAEGVRYRELAQINTRFGKSLAQGGADSVYVPTDKFHGDYLR